MRQSSDRQIHHNANKAQAHREFYRVVTSGDIGTYSGTMARHLVWLDGFARQHGLEIHDPSGHLLHLDDLLAIVHGHAPDGRRARLAWKVELGVPADPVPEGGGAMVREYEPDEIEAGVGTPRGRIIKYAAGATPDPTRFTVIEV